MVSGESLLFIHQSTWQRSMLEKYGGEICLLDATYKTTKFAIPLYFLCVLSNYGYLVVASFVTESESSASIKEALTILKEWNENWKARYFMTDFDEREIFALDAVFEGSNNWI